MAQAAAPAARIEVHVLQSLTLTRHQLLSGRPEGADAATIAGELSLPFVAATRMPAVLMLHGDAGAIANQIAVRALSPATMPSPTRRPAPPSRRS